VELFLFGDVSVPSYVLGFRFLLECGFVGRSNVSVSIRDFGLLCPLRPPDCLFVRERVLVIFTHDLVVHCHLLFLFHVLPFDWTLGRVLQLAHALRSFLLTQILHESAMLH
jgi:hypothetical protein